MEEPYRCWGGPLHGYNMIDSKEESNKKEYYFFTAKGVPQYIWPYFLYEFMHWIGESAGNPRDAGEGFDTYCNRLDMKCNDAGSFLPINLLTTPMGAPMGA